MAQHDTDPENNTVPDPPDGADKAYAAPRKPPKAVDASTIPNANVVINVTREMTQPVLQAPPVYTEPEPPPARPGRSQKDIATVVARPVQEPEVGKRSLVVVGGFAIGILAVSIAVFTAVINRTKPAEPSAVEPSASASAPAPAAASAPASAAATASASASEPAPAPVVSADPGAGHVKKPAASAAPKTSAPAKPGNFVEPARTIE